jgi:hypothetical protein
MVVPSVAVETPPVDTAAVLAAVAEVEAFFFGKQSTGRAKWERRKRPKDRTRIHGSCIMEADKGQRDEKKETKEQRTLGS